MDASTTKFRRPRVASRLLVGASAALLSLLLAFGLTGCFGLGPLDPFPRRGENLTLGGAELTELPASIEIGWVAGKVTVKTYEGDTLAFSEVPTSTPDLPEELSLTWEIFGDTLVIDYVQPAVRPYGLVKELTVLIPEDMHIDDITIDATSADVVVAELTADSVTVSTTSGDIMATTTTRLVSFSSTSGDITVACDARDIEVTSTSGDQQVTQSGSAEDVELASTSGDIWLLQWGYAGELGVEATSGSVRVDLLNADVVDIETTSGAVSVSFSEEWGFTGTLSTTSGRLDYDMPLAKSGRAYVYGDGGHSLEIETTSGGITLKLTK